MFESLRIINSHCLLAYVHLTHGYFNGIILMYLEG